MSYDRVEFHVREKFQQENCENTLVFSIYISDQKFENSIDLLLAIDENKSHYGYIKKFTKERIKTKSIFERSVYSPLKVKMYCTINGAQSVRFEKVTIEFKNYFKQIPVPFKVYAYFECNLGSAESYEGSY